MNLANDKKKLVVLGALFAVIICIGAFQFLAPRPPAKTSAKKAKHRTSLLANNQRNETTPDFYDQVLQAMPERNPFQPDVSPEGNSNETVQEKKNESKAKPEPKRAARKIKSMNIPPLSPMIGELPDASDPATKSATGNLVETRVEPGKILRQSGEPAHTLVGVVLGDTPVAVLQGDDGQQRAVKVGGSVDAQSRIVKIEKGAIHMIHQGKLTTLKLGGTR